MACSLKWKNGTLDSNFVCFTLWSKECKQTNPRKYFADFSRNWNWNIALYIRMRSCSLLQMAASIFLLKRNNAFDKTKQKRMLFLWTRWSCSINLHFWYENKFLIFTFVRFHLKAFFLHSLHMNDIYGCMYIKIIAFLRSLHINGVIYPYTNDSKWIFF